MLPARLLTTLPNTIYSYAVYRGRATEFHGPEAGGGRGAAVPGAPDGVPTRRDDVPRRSLRGWRRALLRGDHGRDNRRDGRRESDVDAACVKAVDMFPPSAPKKLEAVASEGAISLIWEASPEPDVAGYVVLRGEAGSGQLAPLFTGIRSRKRHIVMSA